MEYRLSKKLVTSLDGKGVGDENAEAVQLWRKQAPMGSSSAAGIAPAPQTLGTFAQQVLNDLVPNEESILKLAGMAGNGASAGAGRVKGEGGGGENFRDMNRPLSRCGDDMHAPLGSRLPAHCFLCASG